MQVKLVDFGLSCFYRRGVPQTEVVGSPHFCSPEMASGKGPGYGPASDVWSLGVILYALLSNDYPYSGETPSDILRSIIARPVDYESNPIWRYVSSASMDALQRLLTKEPRDRMTIEDALSHVWMRRHSDAALGAGAVRPERAPPCLMAAAQPRAPLGDVGAQANTARLGVHRVQRVPLAFAKPDADARPGGSLRLADCPPDPDPARPLIPDPGGPGAFPAGSRSAGRVRAQAWGDSATSPRDPGIGGRRAEQGVSLENRASPGLFVAPDRGLEPPPPLPVAQSRVFLTPQDPRLRTQLHGFIDLFRGAFYSATA